MNKYHSWLRPCKPSGSEAAHPAGETGTSGLATIKTIIHSFYKPKSFMSLLP
jgi:hypothetical protein